MLIWLKCFEPGILVTDIWTVWKETDGCAKKYRRDLAINLTIVLSPSYGTIMDRAINAPGHGENVVEGLNSIDKRYLKVKWNSLVN